MIHLLPWQGKGGVVFFLIYLPVVFLGLGTLVSERAALNLSSLGSLTGVICFALGRKWEGDPRRDDRFCTLRVKSWRKIFIVLGAWLLLITSIGYFREQEMRKPIRLPEKKPASML